MLISSYSHCQWVLSFFITSPNTIYKKCRRLYLLSGFMSFQVNCHKIPQLPHLPFRISTAKMPTKMLVLIYSPPSCVWGVPFSTPHTFWASVFIFIFVNLITGHFGRMFSETLYLISIMMGHLNVGTFNTLLVVPNIVRRISYWEFSLLSGSRVPSLAEFSMAAVI